jgi:L-ribulose-5-phosphate 3-epimerase
MKNPIGVMQGRLLPKYQGRYQAHPVDYWQEEFLLAAKLGLDCIEFILDDNEVEQNPLLHKSGRQQIRELSKKTGVQVYSVCADYFMETPLHSNNPESAEISLNTMRRLLEASSDLEIRDVVVPCVDQSSIRDPVARSRFKEKLSEMIPLAEELGVNLSLETDLNPMDFKELLEQFDSSRVTVNYDIGNSVSLGYDPEEELQAYGSLISDIHIKDRDLGGGSVLLGTGNADLPKFFSLLSTFSYKGPFIMQAYRNDEGVKVFQKQFQWVRPFVEGKG